MIDSCTSGPDADAAETGDPSRWPTLEAETGGNTYMKITIDGAVIAEAADDDLVKIEGDWYFPPSSITPGTLSESPTPYICPWKGVAQYHDVTTPLGTRSDAAWSYPDPLQSAVDAVGRNFAGYVAFERAFATFS